MISPRLYDSPYLVGFNIAGWIPGINVFSGGARCALGAADVTASIAARVFCRDTFFERTAGIGVLNIARGIAEAGPFIYLTSYYPGMNPNLLREILLLHSITLIAYDCLTGLEISKAFS